MLFTYPRALPTNFYASDLEKAFFIEALSSNNTLFSVFPVSFFNIAAISSLISSRIYSFSSGVPAACCALSPLMISAWALDPTARR